MDRSSEQFAKSIDGDGCF